jgi:hypothetical protein
MSNVKRGGWVLIGVVVGALAASSIGALKAQSVDPRRLKVTVAGATVAQATFIKDTKSTGCWLVMTRGNDGVAMVTAPPEACE